MGRVLAIDWGARRTGVAVTDSLRLSCNGLPTFATSDLLPWLKKYLETETVDELVIGVPKRLNGDDTHATKPIAEFIIVLRTQFAHIPLFTIDERLSSREAHYYIQNSGLKKSKRREKGLVDSISATIILQTHLNTI